MNTVGNFKEYNSLDTFVKFFRHGLKDSKLPKDIFESINESNELVKQIFENRDIISMDMAIYIISGLDVPSHLFLKKERNYHPIGFWIS